MDSYFCAPLLTFKVGHKRSLKRQRICDPSLGIRCKFLVAAQATPSPPEFMPLCALASSTILGEELSATFSNFMWRRREPALQVALGETSTWHIRQVCAHCIGQLQIYWILAKFSKFTPEFMPLCAFWLAHGGGSKCINEGEVHQGRRRLGLHIYRSAAVQCPDSVLWWSLHLFAVLTCDQPRRRVREGLEGARGLASRETSLYLWGAAAYLRLHLFWT